MVEVQDVRAMGEALGNACAVLRANAASAGLDAPVPTCPGWTVADLVAHQGMVHRWATARLTGAEGFEEVVAIAEAHAATDMLDWFDEGMVDLLNAVATAPADLDVPFFLTDAPPPRDAWLRRQVHETSIHGVDAMAARLGRAPEASELWLAPWLAADGVDELLTGFLPRRRYAPTADPARTVLVTATDADRSWLLTIGPDGTTTERVAGPAEAAEAGTVVSGTARELYLALWNRGGAPAASDPGWWAAWREQVRVAWV